MSRKRGKALARHVCDHHFEEVHIMNLKNLGCATAVAYPGGVEGAAVLPRSFKNIRK